MAPEIEKLQNGLPEALISLQDRSVLQPVQLAQFRMSGALWELQARLLREEDSDLTG
jgi:hypothetical protein